MVDTFFTVDIPNRRRARGSQVVTSPILTCVPAVRHCERRSLPLAGLATLDMTDGARKTVGVMSPVGAEAGDRQAGSRAARLPTGSVLRRGARDRSPWLSLSAVPSSSALSMGDPPAVSSGCGNRRLRDHGRPADVGEASAQVCGAIKHMGCCSSSRRRYTNMFYRHCLSLPRRRRWLECRRMS